MTLRPGVTLLLYGWNNSLEYYYRVAASHSSTEDVSEDGGRYLRRLRNNLSCVSNGL